MPVLRENHIEKARRLWSVALSPSRLQSLARQTGFVRRQRRVTGGAAFWAFVVALGGASCSYVSDVLRTLNAQHELGLRYKPFWNRLAQESFPAFMRSVFAALCRDLSTQAVRRQRGSVVSRFSEIFLDDGSSFAVADGLKSAFPGRFTDKSPAAVGIHAHMSLRTDNVASVSIAPDTATERQFLPRPEDLPKRSLSLRDAGYFDLGYFKALEGRDTYLICRALKTINPTVVELRRGAKQWLGKKLRALPQKKLADADLLVEWQRPYIGTVRLRLVVKKVATRAPTRRKAHRRKWSQKNTTFLLVSNLLDPEVSAEDIASLYRLRWQIELLFKDWKSSANLHGFQTTNHNVAEGLIWASLCAALIKRALAITAQQAAGYEISTRIVAMAGPLYLPDLAAWSMQPRARARFYDILRFLVSNAQRPHPKRSSSRPAQTLGLRPLGVSLKD